MLFIITRDHALLRAISGVFLRKLSQYVGKMLELISRYSKISNICDKGEVCYDGR